MQIFLSKIEYPLIKSCATNLSEGFKTNNIISIEEELGNLYDMFAQVITNKDRETLFVLAHDISIMYKTISIYEADPKYTIQLKSLIILADCCLQYLIPHVIWKTVCDSKHSANILQKLYAGSVCRIADLYGKDELPAKTQLTKIIRSFVHMGIVRREKLGKNVWYSLTRIGILVIQHIINDSAKTKGVI